MQITIEIDGPKNQRLGFLPLMRPIRGAYDMSRSASPAERAKAATGPGPIPGQRIGLSDGVGFIEEPLHYAEHEPLAERIKAKGFRLPPKVEEFTDIDENTWAYHLRKAVDSGLGRIVAGKFSKIDDDAAKKSFVLAERETKSDKLAAAIDRQTDVFEKLLAKMSD